MRTAKTVLGLVVLSLVVCACNPTTTGRATGRTYGAVDRGPYWRYWDTPPIYVPPVLPPGEVIPPEPGLPIEPPVTPEPPIPELPILPGPDFGGGIGGDFGGIADAF